MNDVATLLHKAKSLVKQGWCQHNTCLPKTNGGVKYCVLGAIWNLNNGNEAILAESAFCKANNIDYIPRWNDNWYRFKWQVLWAFDRAIEYAEKELSDVPA